MKTAINLFLLSLLIISTNSCSKQDDCENPVDCLPPATQIGANTAGCLVDGEVLLPRGRSLNSGSILKAQYNFNEGTYNFSIGINDRKKNNLIFIRINNTKLEENGIYPLILKSETKGSASYIIGGAGSGISYVTTNSTMGQLHITKLNELENIISGTFWFDAENLDGEIVKIREGRFDVRYY